jgi:hypothetical protein
MSQKRVPINRLNKFFSGEDFDLDIKMGREWLEGDMNFTLVLYRVDKQKTKTDDVYGEAMSDGISYLPPVEFNAYVEIEESENQNYSNSNLSQKEPGNLKFWVYQETLDELGIEIEFGDYIGYYETETRVRYYSVADDGRIVSANKNTYGGYKPFYRSLVAVPINDSEFRGI